MSYEFEEPATNYIYVPDTGLVGHVAITNSSQSAVDANDMVYTFYYDFGLGENDPFVMGHRMGTMQHLSEVKVGNYVYLKTNGNLEIYEVEVSEFGMQNESWTNIWGNTTGHSIFDNLGTKTLHMYTCVEGVRNGRWMVLAKKIS